MAKLNISAILILFTLFIATQISVNHGRELADEEDDLLVEYRCLKNEKIAKIHYFVQDVTFGPNATVIEVARAANTSGELLAFGNVLVIDDTITATPDAGSKVLGKAQGIMSSTDMHTTAMAMNFNVVFTAGKYNGSSLSIAGRNHVYDNIRRLAVVGGTGVFRYTRGYTLVHTYSSKIGKDSVVYTILEYTVYATYCPAK